MQTRVAMLPICGNRASNKYHHTHGHVTHWANYVMALLCSGMTDTVITGKCQ